MSDPINAVMLWWAAITALATVGGVIVAGLYVALTRTLARAALQQAQAATEQARITRQIFEASHRPILGLVFRDSNFFRDPQVYRLDFVAKNYGQVPAILTESGLIVRHDGETLVDRPVPGRGRCIFPGGEADLEFTEYPEHVVQDTGEERHVVDVELTVSYTGFDDVVRTSRIALVGNFDGWTRLQTEVR
jgi:hypothetical protein